MLVIHSPVDGLTGIEYGQVGVVTMVSAVKMAVELHNATCEPGHKWTWSDIRLSNGLTPYRIMPMGDSITDGVGGTGGGYRGKMFQFFSGLYPFPVFESVGSVWDGQNGNHEGYPGYTTEGLFDVIHSKQTVAQNAPDMVLLMIGTNDLKTRSQAQIKTDIIGVINEIRTQKADVKIILAKIPPWQYDSSYGKQHAALDEVLLQGIAELYLVDNYTGFHGLTGDGVHPNDEGYQWMSENWRAKILEVLGVPS